MTDLTSFFNRKSIKRSLNNFHISQKTLDNLLILQRYIDLKTISERRLQWIVDFILNDLDGYLQRYRTLEDDKHRGSLTNHITRFGQQEGERRYKIFVERRHPHLIGIDIFEQFMNQKAVIVTLGSDFHMSDNAKEKIHPILLELDFGKRMNNDLIRIANFIKFDVKNPHANWLKLKSGVVKRHSEENYQLLYGEAEGRQRYLSFVEKMNTSIHYWIAKGYSEDEAKAIIISNGKKNVLLNIDKIGKSLTKCINKHGNDKGHEVFNDWCRNNNPGRGRGSSHASRIFFRPIMEQLVLQNIAFNVGISGNHEFFLIDMIANKTYYYDFHIPSFKLIIEYHGDCFHPNKAKLSNAEWKKWALPWHPGVTADIKYQQDQRKKKCAESHGFTVFEVWDSDKQSHSVIQRNILNSFLLNDFNKLR